MKDFPFFSLQLKRERLKRGWSQMDVAEKVGGSEKTITRWENGDAFPRPYYRQKLAEIFEISLEALGLSREATDEALHSRIKPHNAQREMAEPQDISPPGHVDHRILGYPPPTHPRTIQQREKAVEAVYTQLTQPDVTAVVLTGMAGAGKSTLAALISQYVREDMKTGEGFFSAEPIWLTFHKDTTIADVLETLFGIVGKALPNLESLSPYNQAITLFHTLRTETQTRLIVLDQFEHVLDPQTGSVLTEYAGFGHWLDIVNSQPAASKMLLTSRFWPRGTRAHPPTYMQEYQVEGLDIVEGVELLKKQGVETQQGTPGQLEAAVAHCEGHVFALTLLASLLRRNRSLNLSLLLGNDASYARLWHGDIARNLLDLIYFVQLNETQRQLLFAFSIYREAVPLQASLALLKAGGKGQEDHWLLALEVLLAQHLLHASGNARYYLHAIVADYLAEQSLNEKKGPGKKAVLEAHARAAQYYLQHALVSCPPREQRQSLNDVRPLIEAVWQRCQAEQWSEAYDLIQREELYMGLRRWGGHAVLLEIYQPFQSFEKWQPAPEQEAEILDHLGRIYSLFGEKEKALHYYRQALLLSQRIGARRVEGRTLNHMGLISESSDALLEAKTFHERAHEIASSLGDQKGEADSLSGLGWIFHRLGQHEQGLRCCEQALSIHQEIGNQKGVGDTLNCLGLISFEQGAKGQALQAYEQALAIRQETGDKAGEGKTLNNLGLLYTSLGQEKEAYSHYTQSLRIRREIGDSHGEGIVLFNLGKTYMTNRRDDIALACLLQACTFFEEGHHVRYESARRRIELLRDTIGHTAFASLQTQIEPRVSLIVEQVLRQEG